VQIANFRSDAPHQLTNLVDRFNVIRIEDLNHNLELETAVVVAMEFPEDP
jgi:hypothetical protein